MRFDIYLVERPRRRTVQDGSRFRVKAALVTRTFKPVMVLCVMNRTRQVCAFLAKCGVGSILRSHEDRRFVARIMKVDRRAGLQFGGAVDRHRRKHRSFACIYRRLGRKAGGADKERGRGQHQKIAKFASRDLRFLVAFIRKLGLVRRRCGADILFVERSDFR